MSKRRNALATAVLISVACGGGDRLSPRDPALPGADAAERPEPPAPKPVDDPKLPADPTGLADPTIESSAEEIENPAELSPTSDDKNRDKKTIDRSELPGVPPDSAEDVEPRPDR